MGGNTDQIVYTAIAGGKDRPRNDVKVFDAYDRFVKPVLNAKIYKVLSHLYIEGAWSIWIDGNITLKVEPEELIRMLGDKDIGVFPNPYRQCLYAEAAYCALHKKDSKEVIEEQVARYRKEGFPKNYGLGACGVIVRRHTEKIKRLNEQWWAEICRGSTRDQISFPYVYRDAIQFFPEVDIFENHFFKRVGHTL